MFDKQFYSNNLLEDESYNELIDEVMKVDYKAFYRGTVVENNDPMQMGRVKVRVPQIYGAEDQKDESIYVPSYSIPWATSAIMAGAGNNTGAYLIPNIGDTVLVTFEGGDPNLPLYFGGLLTRYGKDKYIGTTDANNDRLYEVNGDDFNTDINNGSQRVIYKSIKGATIIIDDKDEDESIKIIDQLGQFISLENVGSEALGRNRSGGIESRERSGRIVIKDAYEDSIDLHNGEIHIKTPKIVIETDDIKQVGYEDKYPEEVGYADIILGDEEPGPDPPDPPEPPEPEEVTWYFNILGTDGAQGQIYLYDEEAYYNTPVSITRLDGESVDVDFSCNGYQTVSTRVTFDKDAVSKETIVTLEPIPATYGSLMVYNDTDLPILVGVILDVDDNYQNLTEFNTSGAFYSGESFSLSTLYEVGRTFSISVVRYDLFARYNYFVSFESGSSDIYINASDILEGGCYYSNACVYVYDPNDRENITEDLRSVYSSGKIELTNTKTGDKYYSILSGERLNSAYVSFPFGSNFTFYWNYDRDNWDPDREDYIDYIGFCPMTEANIGVNIDLSSDTRFYMRVPIKNGIYTCRLVVSDISIDTQSTLYAFGPNFYCKTYKSAWNTIIAKSCYLYMPMRRDVNVLSTIYNKQIYIPNTNVLTGELPVIVSTYFNSTKLGRGISMGIRPLPSSGDYNSSCMNVYAGILGPSGELDENFRFLFSGSWSSPLTSSASPSLSLMTYKPKGLLTMGEITRQVTLFYTYETQGKEAKTITINNDLGDVAVFGFSFYDFTDSSSYLYDISEFDQIKILSANETQTITISIPAQTSNFNKNSFMVSFLRMERINTYGSYFGSFNNEISWGNSNIVLNASDFTNGNIGHYQEYMYKSYLRVSGYTQEELDLMTPESTHLYIYNRDTGFSYSTNLVKNGMPTSIRIDVFDYDVFIFGEINIDTYYLTAYFKPQTYLNSDASTGNCVLPLPCGVYEYYLENEDHPELNADGTFTILGEDDSVPYYLGWVNSGWAVEDITSWTTTAPFDLQTFNDGEDTIRILQGSSEHRNSRATVGHKEDGTLCGAFKYFLTDVPAPEQSSYDEYISSFRAIWGQSYEGFYVGEDEGGTLVKFPTPTASVFSFAVTWLKTYIEDTNEISKTVTIDLYNTGLQSIGDNIYVKLNLQSSSSYRYIYSIYIYNYSKNKAIFYSDIVAKYKGNQIFRTNMKNYITGINRERIIVPSDADYFFYDSKSNFQYDYSTRDLQLIITGTEYTLSNVEGD